MITSRTIGLSTRSLLRLAIVVMLVSVPNVALADLPRPPGWEPTCTLEKEQKKGGELCEQCRGWRDPDPCQKALESKGLTRRCTEGGAGSFVAIWCKGATGAPNTTSTPPAATTATAITTTTTNTTATTTTTAAPTTPPPVAPATDNRRGSGMCSVQAISHDKPFDILCTLVPVAIVLGLQRRRGSSSHER